jgi:N-succinyldiaminopimelate aminotransferase
MYSGHPLLREKLSSFYSPFFSSLTSKSIDPNTEILVTNGACEALFCAVHHLAQPGDEVLMFEPYYTSYVNHIEFAGAKIKTAPMILKDGNWTYDLDAFEKSITKNTKVVMITNPHNPTGKLFTLEEL